MNLGPTDYESGALTRLSHGPEINNRLHYTKIYIDGKKFRKNIHVNNKRVAELY